MADFLPHVGAALVTACIILTFLRRFSDRRATMVLCFALSFVILLIPIGNYPASHYIRVLTGDLSIFGFFWLGAAAVQVLATSSRFYTRQERHIAMALLVAALVLYPSALGLSPLDSYSIGYLPNHLGPAVFILFLCALWLNYWVAAAGLAAALFAFYFSALESNNLWDYLMDPVIVFYSIFILMKTSGAKNSAKSTGPLGQPVLTKQK